MKTAINRPERWRLSGAREMELQLLPDVLAKAGGGGKEILWFSVPSFQFPAHVPAKLTQAQSQLTLDSRKHSLQESVLLSIEQRRGDSMAEPPFLPNHPTPSQLMDHVSQDMHNISKYLLRGLLGFASEWTHSSGINLLPSRG